ncbi:MAG: hypothetical protein QG628_701 [Patescibacteria group bacterium]|nr:hypothetical protein [Patescibacteria group bacterium]
MIKYTLMSNFEPPVYVDDPVNFGLVSDCRAPSLLDPSIKIADDAIAECFLPVEKGMTNEFLYLASIDERNRLSRAGNVLGRLMCHAQDIETPDLTPDHDLFMQYMDREDLTTDEFLVGFGIYTTSVRATNDINVMSTDSTTPVVHLGVRKDMVQLFTKAERLYESLDDEAKAEFVQSIAFNFAPNHDDTGSVKHPAYASQPWNSSIFIIRNATLDIVTNCESPLDPATIMATRLVRNFVEKSEVQSNDRLVELLTTFVKDPKVLLRNPELVFVLDTIWSNSYTKKQNHLQRKEVERTADGIVLSIFNSLRENDNVDEYSKKLVAVYFEIADRSVSQIERRSAISEKPSEGGYHNVAVVLTSLASNVAQANGDTIRFTPSDYGRAFDYILPFIDTEALWPDLEPETVITFEKAFSKIVHLTTQ